MHAYHYFGSTLYSEWLQAFKGNPHKARDFSELQAYKWERIWGGNINYAAPKSPQGYIDYYKASFKSYNILRLYPGNYY